MRPATPGSLRYSARHMRTRKAGWLKLGAKKWPVAVDRQKKAKIKITLPHA